MIKSLNRKPVLNKLKVYSVAIFGVIFIFYGCFALKDNIISSEVLPITQSVSATSVCDDPNNTTAYCKGSWTSPLTAPITAVHSFVLPNGKVLMFTSDNNNYSKTKAYTYDPNSQNFTDVTYSPTTDGNVFCAGHDFLQDGRLLISGGHNGNNNGIKETTIFDYRNSGTNLWSRPSNSLMNDGRWYPSNCTLGNGEQLLMMGNPYGGPTLNHTYNDDLEIWRNRNKIYKIPSQTFPSIAANNYPFSFLNKYGLVFIAGPVNHSVFINPKDGTSFQGNDSTVNLRDYGSPVMYKEGKVLVTGGGNNPNDGYHPFNSAETIDINGVNSNCQTSSTCPAWTTVDHMNFRRRHHNATVLPDGKVLVTGGSDGTGHSDAGSGVLEAEIWDPDAATGHQWTVLASMARPRLYHSTAVLLPSGKVLVGGGDWIFSTSSQCASNCQSACTTGVANSDSVVGYDYYCNLPEANLETFSPPYLFNSDGTAATRPVITSAPVNVGYNKTFSIGVDSPSSISKVSWVRLSAVTHAFNQGQRINFLSYTTTTSGLKITTPADGNSCPPGYYMLFVLNSSGVPSEAKIIQITDAEAARKADFDNDRKTDFTLWRPSSGSGYWYTTQSTNSQSISYQFGLGTDQPVPGDYDGDGITDYAIRRLSNNQWTIKDSSDGTVNYVNSFGLSTDIAVPADYDGDRLTDVAIFRQSTGEWAILQSSTGTTVSKYSATSPQTGDLPVPGDYDGDGKADIAFWRPSNGTWYITLSSNSQQRTVQFGLSGDYLVPNDYDGDSITDIAIWRPSNNQWTILNSSDNSVTYYSYGLSTDIPVSADYDGDGKADVAIYRPSTGEWAVYKSSTATSSSIYYGLSSDIPIPSIYYRH